MDVWSKLSRNVQFVLGGAVLALIFSFFDWQQVCVSGGGFSACAGVSEWHGFGGTITVLVALLLLAWEVARLLSLKIPLGGISPALISVGLAGLLLVLTIITFLNHNEARHWPSYIGLLLAIVIGVAAFMRGKEEGVKMSDLDAVKGAMSSIGSSGSSAGASSDSAAPAPSAPAPPVEAPPAPPAEPAGDAPAETPPSDS